MKEEEWWEQYRTLTYEETEKAVDEVLKDNEIQNKG